MKSLKILLVIVLLCTAAFAQPNVSKFQKFEFARGGFTFKIDPRNEMFYTMFVMLGYPGTADANFQYKRDILKYFSKYKDLEEVKGFDAHFKSKWNDLSDPAFFTIQFDDNFDLLPYADKNIVDKNGGKQSMIRLGKLFRSFIKKTNYVQFFNSQKPFFDAVLGTAGYNFRAFNERQLFDDFFKMKTKSFTVIFNLLEWSGNFGPHLETPDGAAMYAFITAEGFAGEIPVYKMSSSFLGLVYHEFSHSFTNPLVEKNKDELNKCAYLFEPVKESMAGQAYPDWITCLCEHMVRAVAIHFAEQKFGKEQSDLIFKKKEIGHKFIYVDNILRLIDEYEANKQRYQSFADFFPAIVKMITEIPQTEIPQLMTKAGEARLPDVDGILKPYEVPVDSNSVLIISTHEPGNGNQLVKEFAADYNGRSTVPGVKTLTDDEALLTDLKNANLFIYGTPEGNSFLKKYLSSIPVIIHDSYVVAGEKIEGNNLQFIFSWVSPFNKNKSMVITSAHHAADMVNYNWSMIREGNNFWIANNLVPMKTGNFVRMDKIWYAQ